MLSLRQDDSEYGYANGQHHTIGLSMSIVFTLLSSTYLLREKNLDFSTEFWIAT
jgi:hypothetical protein